MTDDYTPLTDEQVGAIRDDLQWRVPDVLRRILADREHYKRRAETAERLLGLVAPHACWWCHGFGFRPLADEDVACDHPSCDAIREAYGGWPTFIPWWDDDE